MNLVILYQMIHSRVDRLIKILEKADKEDLIFAAITGGSSALVNKPAGEITLRIYRR